MYTEEMLESIKKVEASRASRIGKELRRMDADEKDNLLKEFHPDYKESGFATLEMGPNKGERHRPSWPSCCRLTAVYWARILTLPIRITMLTCWLSAAAEQALPQP